MSLFTHQEDQTTVLVPDLVGQVDTLALTVTAVPLGQLSGKVRAVGAMLEVDLTSTVGEVTATPDEPAWGSQRYVQLFNPTPKDSGVVGTMNLPSLFPIMSSRRRRLGCQLPSTSLPAQHR